jgi:HD-like signal output (HDOD) protein
MEVQCQNCQKTYQIPEERLQYRETVTFPCPACKAFIRIDPSQRPVAAEAGTDPSSDSHDRSGSADDLKKRILKSIGDLPPMPQVVFKAREILADANSSFEDLAKVLESDPAVATRILKMANSPYYGLMGEVSSIQHASVVLGYKALADLITMAGTSELMGKTLKGYELNAEDLWRHAMGVAIGSRLIAEKKHPSLSNDAFAAGLIHDVGKLILDPYVLQEKKAFDALMADGEKSFLSAEKEILGFDHAEIAAEACKHWHVPETITDAIQYHHFPSDSPSRDLTHTVHMADAAAMLTGLSLGVDGIHYRMDEKTAEILGLEDEDIAGLMVEVVESVENIYLQFNE